MSDHDMPPWAAAMETRLRQDTVRLRSDIMERIDRLQEDLAARYEDSVANFATADRARDEVRSLRRQMDSLEAQVAAMVRLIQRLQSRRDGDEAKH